MANWTPPQYDKTPAQREEIRRLIQQLKELQLLIQLLPTWLPSILIPDLLLSPVLHGTQI